MNAKTSSISAKGHKSERHPHRDRKTKRGAEGPPVNPAAPGDTVLQRKTDAAGGEELTPALQAVAAGKAWHEGAGQLVEACKIIATGWRAFDNAQKNEFVQKLHQERVLSRFEAALGQTSPKLTKLIAIGDAADKLGRSDVIGYFEPQYSTLYQASVLLKTVGAEKFVDLLRGQRGEITRDLLKRMNDNERPSPPHTDNGPQSPKPTGETEADFDLVKYAPTEGQIKRLAAQLSDPDSLASEISARQRIGKNSAVLFLGRVRDLPHLVGLMKLIGKQHTHIFLTRRPLTADIAGAEVCLISDGGRALGLDIVKLWEVERTPGELVEALFPESQNDVTLFVNHAKGEAPSAAA